MCRPISSGSGLILTLLLCSLTQADETVSISDAKQDQVGLLVHQVRSPYQSETTTIRVLRPDNWPADKECVVVYVLPVEARAENRYGDGMLEILKLDLHNKHGLTFVAPTFSQLPWYADHPSNTEIRQESYFLNVVVPSIDKAYPVRADASGRLLLGFSKSGWGAWSLLLRHPDTFGKAVAWDAPLMLDKPGKYGSGAIFGTADNFEGYRVSELLRAKAKMLQPAKRLILLGYGNFRNEHEQVHTLMDTWQIAHEYRDGPQRNHDWHSGWVKEAVELLAEP